MSTEHAAVGSRLRVVARRRPFVYGVRFVQKLGVLRAYGVSPVRRPGAFLRYLATDRELTNFTYDLANSAELSSFVARALDISVDEVAGYQRELDGDAAFLAALAERLRTRPDRNRTPKFGRRVGWYCVVRAAKPALVIETGTHDGLGTSLLARALQRNADEGHGGRLISFDVTPGTGWLVPDDLRGIASLVTGDVREELPRALAGERVDVFIHDSLHTYEHERFEFDLALQHAGDPLVLISDNAHASDALRDLAGEIGADFSYFGEQPLRHFYPGAGIGLAVRRSP